MLTAEVRALLRAGAPEPLVVVALGNPLRGDDGIGPYVAGRLRGRCRPGTAVVEAADRPEDALEPVIALKPGRVVILDAADFGGRAGEARMIAADQVPQTALSTHRFPPAALAGLIAADTRAPVAFLGIQAGAVGLGAPLSEAVRQTGDAIVACLRGDDPGK